MASEGPGIAAGLKYFGVPLQGGGGPFAVIPYEKAGRIPPNTPVVAGHTANVLDIAFNPFHENIVASSSDDGTVKVRL